MHVYVTSRFTTPDTLRSGSTGFGAGQRIQFQSWSDGGRACIYDVIACMFSASFISQLCRITECPTDVSGIYISYLPKKRQSHTIIALDTGSSGMHLRRLFPHSADNARLRSWSSCVSGRNIYKQCLHVYCKN